MTDTVSIYEEGFSKADSYQNMTRLTREEAEHRESSMTIHHIMPGVDVFFNHFSSRECVEPGHGEDSLHVLEINHCRQGRYGCQLEEDRYVYLGQGELEVNILGIKRLHSEFPLGFYDGVSILVDVEEMAAAIQPLFPEIARQLAFLQQHVLQHGGAMLIRRMPALNHIFEELYHVNPMIEQAYIKLKVMEILLTMQTIPFARESSQSSYFRRSDMDKVKALHQEAIHRLGEKIPLQVLAQKYDIAQTTLKSCFKEIYGSPYYAYMKRYRIHAAVHELEAGTYSITEIAGMVGYENASKFTAAFKSVMGCTPREYKKNADQMEHLHLLGVEIE